MLYHVTIAGRTLPVELGEDGITVDGVRIDSAELQHLAGSGLHHLLTSGASHAVLATTTEAGSWDMHIDGHRINATVVDERTRAIRALTKAGSASTGPRPVRAPMPGLVVRVEVAEGDTVSAGQGVLIMEAMKMENELRADAGGTVSRVLVQPGQAVEKGAVLIEFTGGAHG